MTHLKPYFSSQKTVFRTHTEDGFIAKFRVFSEKIKKIISYFYPLTLEQTASEYNRLLEVQLSKGRYMLLTENAIYSYGDLYDNYGDSFKKMELPSHENVEVLVLGLGLGSIPQMLEQVWKKNYGYTCVEIDETVIQLAEKYVLKNLKSPIDIICGDALHWVEITEQQFDIICVDIFVDTATPIGFRQADFLEQCYNLLAENGVLLYNCLGYDEKDCHESERFYHQTFKKGIEKTALWKLRANYMLVAWK